jgi:hypothetical protein
MTKEIVVHLVTENPNILFQIFAYSIGPISALLASLLTFRFGKSQTDKEHIRQITKENCDLNRQRLESMHISMQQFILSFEHYHSLYSKYILNKPIDYEKAAIYKNEYEREMIRFNMYYSLYFHEDLSVIVGEYLKSISDMEFTTNKLQDEAFPVSGDLYSIYYECYSTIQLKASKVISAISSIFPTLNISDKDIEKKRLWHKKAKNN